MAHESALALPLWLQNAARPPSPIIRARMAESRTPISVWTLADDCHTDYTPTHGYEPTREAAMAAFAKSWRRRKAVMEESLVCGHITLLPVSPFRSLSSSSLRA
jgi:hypothetical protein